MNKIVVLSASWCGPCKMLKPIIEEVQPDFEAVEVKLVDVDSPEGQAMCREHNVRGVPTCIAFDGDTVVKTKVGSMTKPEVVDFFTA